MVGRFVGVISVLSAIMVLLSGCGGKNPTTTTPPSDSGDTMLADGWSDTPHVVTLDEDNIMGKFVAENAMKWQLRQLLINCARQCQTDGTDSSICCMVAPFVLGVSQLHHAIHTSIQSSASQNAVFLKYLVGLRKTVTDILYTSNELMKALVMPASFALHVAASKMKTFLVEGRKMIYKMGRLPLCGDSIPDYAVDAKYNLEEQSRRVEQTLLTMKSTLDQFVQMRPEQMTPEQLKQLLDPLGQYFLSLRQDFLDMTSSLVTMDCATDGRSFHECQSQAVPSIIDVAAASGDPVDLDKANQHMSMALNMSSDSFPTRFDGKSWQWDGNDGDYHKKSNMATATAYCSTLKQLLLCALAAEAGTVDCSDQVSLTQNSEWDVQAWCNPAQQKVIKAKPTASKTEFIVKFQKLHAKCTRPLEHADQWTCVPVEFNIGQSLYHSSDFENPASHGGCLEVNEVAELDEFVSCDKSILPALLVQSMQSRATETEELPMDALADGYIKRAHALLDKSKRLHSDNDLFMSQKNVVTYESLNKNGAYMQCAERFAAQQIMDGPGAASCAVDLLAAASTLCQHGDAFVEREDKNKAALAAWNHAKHNASMNAQNPCVDASKLDYNAASRCSLSLFEDIITMDQVIIDLLLELERKKESSRSKKKGGHSASTSNDKNTDDDVSPGLSNSYWESPLLIISLILAFCLVVIGLVGYYCCGWRCGCNSHQPKGNSYHRLEEAESSGSETKFPKPCSGRHAQSKLPTVVQAGTWPELQSNKSGPGHD